MLFKRKIKVCFIAQNFSIWEREKPLFESLSNDRRFKVDMLIVPDFDIKKQGLIDTFLNNRFCSSYPNAIKANINNQLCIKNIKITKYDYVFYQRPYDDYLPLNIRSSNIKKCKTRLCYIPYGEVYTQNALSFHLNNMFYQKIDYYFCENKYIKQEFDLLQNSKCNYLDLGNISLEKFIQLQEKKNNSFNLCWAPRWTYDGDLGGSHFFEYKEDFLLLREISNESIFFRPHPLMFESFISKRLMTEQEKIDYLNRMNKNDIKHCDNDLFECLSDVDILISDFSSIIFDFFLTGRPIIFCPPKEIEFLDFFNEIKDTLYIANNWDEVLKYINMLRNSNDSTYLRRIEIIKKYKYHEGSTNRIKEFLYSQKMR